MQYIVLNAFLRQKNKAAFNLLTDTMYRIINKTQLKYFSCDFSCDICVNLCDFFMILKHIL